MYFLGKLPVVVIKHQSKSLIFY